jgi:integrase/recombinase XerD
MCKWLGDPDLDAITLQDWQRYFVHLRTDYKPRRINGDTSRLTEASIDNHWKVIRGFYNWAVDAQILSSQRPDLKLPRQKFESPQIKAFTPEEIKKLIASSAQTEVVKSNGRRYKIKRPNADRDLAIIMMLLDTGLRVGEAARLTVGDINLDNGEIYVRPFRSGQKTKSRTVYLGAKSRQAVWKYIAKRQAQGKLDQPLFQLKGSSIRLLLRAIGKNAGIANVHPHRFRHTFAIMYLRNRGDVFTLKRLLGHSTMDMVMRYLDIVREDLQDAHRYASPVDNL